MREANICAQQIKLFPMSQYLTKNNLRDNLIALHKHLDLSASQFYKLCGITKPTYNRIISGETEHLSQENSIIISYNLHILYDELLCLSQKQIIALYEERKDWEVKDYNDLFKKMYESRRFG